MKFSRIFFFLKYSNKNLWRRKSRSILLGLSLFLISFLCVVCLGFSNGLSTQMFQGAVQHFLGNGVIISHKSLLNALSYEKVESFDNRELIASINPSLKNITFRKQYRTMGFLYTDKIQQISMLLGVDHTFQDKVDIIKGNNLHENTTHQNEILLPLTLANHLNVNIGDNIAIEVVTADGRRNFDYFRVSGFYRIKGVSDIFIGHIAITNLKDIQFLMNENPHMITELILNFKDQTIQPINPADVSTLNLKKYHMMNWKEYGSLFVAIMKAFNTTIWIVWSITMIIIVVFIFDTMFSIIEERKKEYGIMMSMGLSGTQIAGLVSSEFFVLTLYFVLPGILFGWFAVVLFGFFGIPISSDGLKVMVGGFNNIYPHIEGVSIMILFFMTFIQIEMMSLVAFYKINQLKPLEVIEHA